MDQEYDVAILRKVDEIRSLESEWSHLADVCPGTLTFHEWFLAGARTLYEDGSLHTIVVRRGDRVVGIAPLAHTRRDGAHWLELIGAPDLHEPSGFLYRDRDALESLCSVVTRTRWPVALERVPRGHLIKEQLALSQSRAGRIVEAGTTKSPFVEINSDWEQFFQSISSRRRYDFRRARRALERHGEVAVTFSSLTATSATDALLEAFQVEARSWKGKAGSALDCSLRLRGFFLNLGVQLAAQGKLVVAFLRLNNVPIAMQIAAVHSRTYWLLKIGHDEEWAKVSPGFQLMMDVVRMIHELRFRRLEFLGAAEPWLNIWATGAREYTNLFFVPYTLGGIRAAAPIAGRRMISRILSSGTRRG